MADLMHVREMREYAKTGKLPKEFLGRVKAAIRRDELEQELRDLEPRVFEMDSGEVVHYFPTAP